MILRNIFFMAEEFWYRGIYFHGSQKQLSISRVQSESDSYASARLVFRLRRPLSLLNFNHWWFRFQTVQCFHVVYIQHLALKGLRKKVLFVSFLFCFVFLDYIKYEMPTAYHQQQAHHRQRRAFDDQKTECRMLIRVSIKATRLVFIGV